MKRRRHRLIRTCRRLRVLMFLDHAMQLNHDGQVQQLDGGHPAAESSE